MATVSQRLARRRQITLPDQKVMVLVLVSIIVAYLTAIPLAMLIWGSFKAGDPTAEGGLTLQNYVKAYTDPASLRLFTNSVLYAAGTCALSLVIGTALAWITERTNTPLRNLFYALTLVPLIVPGILGAVAWIFLLSPKIGFINHLLVSTLGLSSPPFDVYTIWGMIWIEGLHLSPLVFVMMSAALKSMDPSLEESAMMSGAGILATLRRVTLKLMLPTVASVTLIMFVRGLESFEVPALVGIPGRVFVFTSKIYLAIHQYPSDFGLAGAFAVSLLVLSIIGIRFYYQMISRSERYATVTGKAFRPRMIDLGRWKYLTSGILILYFVVLVGLPFFVLVWSSLNRYYRQPDLSSFDKLSLDGYQFILNLGKAQTAFLNSFELAVGTATVIMLLTSVIAWITVKTKTPGRQVLDAFAFLPIAFPGIVLGVSLIWVYLILPIPIYGTIWILLIAYITRFMPYGIRSCTSSMVQIHKELEEAAHTSGASWMETFTRVVLPLLKPALLGGWIYIVIVSIRELSSSVLLYSGQSIILSILVFDLWDGGQYAALSALAVMMIIALVVLVLILQKLAGKFGVKGI
ncbi:MAG: iron ABC transporter permease [Chloroflexi bacterium]|nr:iron ABC transporter permease [Chloroflexota bacterium]